MNFIPKYVFDWENFETVYPYFFRSSNLIYSVQNNDFGTMHKVEVDDENCSGQIELLEMGNGLTITVIDCVWFHEHIFPIRDGDWIRFNFSQSINVDMHLSDDKAVKIVKPSWRIINYPADQIVYEKIPANKRSSWVTVCCKRDMIEKFIGDNFENLPSFLQDTLPLSNKESYHDFHSFTSRLNAITADILKTRLTDTLRMAYINARSVELICHALDHLIYSPTNIQAVKLSEQDEQALEEAHKILIQEFAPAPSISNLSRRLGINRNKLFYGFKVKYGCSVSEFIQTQRLEEGKRLLQHSDLSISEIASRVGFNHQSNFATAIKRNFSLTPKQFRQ